MSIKGLLVFIGVSDDYSQTRITYKAVFMFFAVKNMELVTLILCVYIAILSKNKVFHNA